MNLSNMLAQLSPEARAQLEAQMQAVQQARAAAGQGNWPAAIHHQQAAVSRARTLANNQREPEEALVQLSVLLYNLATYYQQAGRHAEAVAALEEVVALDEQTGHADLEDDRRALAQARQLAEQAVGQPASPAQTNTELDGLLSQLPPHIGQMFAQQWQQSTPEDREKLRHWLAQTVALPPDEQQAVFAKLSFDMVEASLLSQIGALLADHRSKPLAPAAVAEAVSQVIDVAGQLEKDESLGQQRQDLVELLRCAAAYLRGEAVSVPVAYAELWAGWMGEGRDRED
jgi:tetratricopeptide (TPR) repeat protein